MKKVILLAMVLFAVSCSKDKGTTTNTNTTNTVDNGLAKWVKTRYVIQYDSTGTIEKYRSETTYDSEGRITSSFSYSNNVLASKSYNFIYNGDECTSTTEYYNNGVITSKTVTKTGFKND